MKTDFNTHTLRAPYTSNIYLDKQAPTFRQQHSSQFHSKRSKFSVISQFDLRGRGYVTSPETVAFMMHDCMRFVLYLRLQHAVVTFYKNQVILLEIRK